MSSTKSRRSKLPVEARSVGRPTLFEPAMLKRVKRYCLLGATDLEIAEAIGIGISTFYTWQRTYPEFRKALQSGKVEADTKIAARMYRDGLMGNTTAQIFWLKNRRRGEWRDVNHRELSGPNGGPIPILAGTMIVDVKALDPKKRDQLKSILLAAKAQQAKQQEDDNGQ
jgi:hypothetical protein